VCASPDPSKALKLPAGVLVPMGPEVQGKIDGSSLLYNEFVGAFFKEDSICMPTLASSLLLISFSVCLPPLSPLRAVYDTAQIKMKYLVKMK
jgi:hypothetical protein